jgi:hypothetical protein
VKSELKFPNWDDFFKNSTPCTAVEEILKEQQPSDTLQKEMEAWSELGPKVVGAEE